MGVDNNQQEKKDITNENRYKQTAPTQSKITDINPKTSKTLLITTPYSVPHNSIFKRIKPHAPV